MKDVLICILVLSVLGLFQGYLNECVKYLQKDKQCYELNVKLEKEKRRC